MRVIFKCKAFFYCNKKENLKRNQKRCFDETANDENYHISNKNERTAKKKEQKTKNENHLALEH